MVWAWVGLAIGLVGAYALLRWGMRFGSTQAERAQSMPGDDWLAADGRPRVVMTRAITLVAFIGLGGALPGMGAFALLRNVVGLEPGPLLALPVAVLALALVAT